MNEKISLFGLCREYSGESATPSDGVTDNIYYGLIEPLDFCFSLTKDGDKYCFLTAKDNLQTGIAGFGDTIAEALTDLLTTLIAKGKALDEYCSKGDSKLT